MNHDPFPGFMVKRAKKEFMFIPLSPDRLLPSAHGAAGIHSIQLPALCLLPPGIHPGGILAGAPACMLLTAIPHGMQASFLPPDGHCR